MEPQQSMELEEMELTEIQQLRGHPVRAILVKVVVAVAAAVALPVAAEKADQV
jgi:hypothetical protein